MTGGEESRPVRVQITALLIHAHQNTQGQRRHLPRAASPNLVVCYLHRKRGGAALPR